MKKFILITIGLLSLANIYASDLTYRNVALNPKAGDGSYPQATTNSQYNDTVFAANNAINANNKDKILLDTDSLLSSQYLDFFSPNGCLNNQCVY